MDQDDGVKPAPQPYSHLTLNQYRSLILRETEPPFSSSLPGLPPTHGGHGRGTNGDDEANRYSSTSSIAETDRQKQYQTLSYACANCSTPLFPASSKFASGTGWPSFSSALPGAVKTKTDWRVKEGGKWVLGGSLGVKFREEVVCDHCGGHLGHVFRGENWEGVDEEEAGKGVTRYCVNGCSLALPGQSSNKD
ncbi:hypothetical protein H072_10633 [Dactylellina haptotyla CBS 200.50]|uniref:MsrB domain-containing protein n=1 Tax=Dactylellina haptotyla (strain CBS 200.50) TaxID=1284197 RepID=S7ZYV4_DACHA|nr:hypothetical protein H072_10633 [Dactylellina haptotyla CBS 200.50]